MRNKHRTILAISIVFMPLFGFEIASMYSGIILFPTAIVLGFLVYTIFYDALFKIVSIDNDENTYIANRYTKQLMMVLAFVVAVLLIGVSNRLLMYSSDATTLIVVNKAKFRSARSHCYQIELENKSLHCVEASCWNQAVIGEDLTLTPRYGLFGIRKNDIPCHS